jgi:hypothetical protein
MNIDSTMGHIHVCLLYCLLVTIRGPLSQIVPRGTRTTDSDGGLSVGLQLLQQHAVKLDNDQIIASELSQLQSPLQSPRAVTCTNQIPA